jgi:hypothetical protein
MIVDIDQFIAEIPILEIQKILEDYEVFRKVGSIGDCSLRNYAEDFMRKNGVEGPSILWLDRLGLEIYRYSALILMGRFKGKTIIY